MKYQNYIKQSDDYMHSLFMCMDNAWAAEKMFSWDNLGEDNLAWKIGPYLSAGANCEQIDRTKPYCLRMSKFSSILAGYLLGPNPVVGENGGVSVGHDRDKIKANILIPTVAICMQYALLESLDFDLFHDWAEENGVDLDEKPAKLYERRPVRSRLKTLNDVGQGNISEECGNAYESLSNFRNVLTHEPNVFCKDPAVAIEVYITCQAVSYELFKLTFGEWNDVKIAHRKPIWAKRLGMFDEVLEFDQ